MGRYMEAMVVCRRGARVNASSPKPHLLLAEVYVAQGKEAKAKEEAQVALQMAPNDIGALRLCGHLQMKLGETEEGTAKLLAAARADLTDMQTQAVLSNWGIAMPLPPPTVVAEPTFSPSSPPSPSRPPSPSNPPSPSRSQAAVPSSPPQKVDSPQTSSAPPSRTPPSAPPVRRPQWIPPMEMEEEEPKKRGGPNVALWSLVIVIGGVFGLLIYYWVGQNQQEKQLKVTSHLRSALEQFRRDNHTAYQKAADEARKALELDKSSVPAHAYLAYAQALRWGEHAGGDEALREAERHLAIAKQSGEVFAYTYMAEALLDYYRGKGQQAEATLAGLVQKHESEGKKPAMLLMTLGTLQMGLGDLDAASESLEKAQTFAPDEPRIYAMLARLARQKGNTSEAGRLYGRALKYESTHPDSLIGRSWAILEQAEPGLSYIAAAEDLSKLLGGKLGLSVRQEAMAHMLNAFLVARVSADLSSFKSEFQEALGNRTGIGTNRAENAKKIAAAEDAARIDSQNPELQLVRAQRLAAEGDVEGAIKQINQAILVAPSARVYFQIELARLWMRKELASKEAEEGLRKAQSLMPRNPVIPVLLAKILLAQRKAEDAISVLQVATANSTTKNPEAKMLLARIVREDKKDYSKAIALYTEAASEFGKDKANVVQAYIELGITHEKAGDLPKSKEAYEQVIREDYTFETAYCRLGDVLEVLAEAEDKERLQKLATSYLSVPAWVQQGECASKMQKRAPANK